jgi:hypothetical protein
MDEIIFGFKDDLAWLENQSLDELQGWLGRFLETGASEPLFISSKDIYRSQIVYQYHRGSDDPEFKKRLKQAIANLLIDWRLDVGSIEQAVELVTLVGRLRVTKAFGRVLAMAKGGMLKGKIGTGVDLHYQILRVLAGFQLDFDARAIARRDMSDPRYAAICFYAVWQRKEGGFKEAVDFVPRLLERFQIDPTVNIHYTLREYLGSLGIDNFRNLFNLILGRLGDDFFPTFRQVLRDIGVNIQPHSRYGFIIYWSLGPQKTLAWEVIPSPYADFKYSPPDTDQEEDISLFREEINEDFFNPSEYIPTFSKELFERHGLEANRERMISHEEEGEAALRELWYPELRKAV